jgi:hypothetical protein
MRRLLDNPLQCVVDFLRFSKKLKISPGRVLNLKPPTIVRHLDDVNRVHAGFDINDRQTQGNVATNHITSEAKEHTRTGWISMVQKLKAWPVFQSPHNQKQDLMGIW